MAMVMMRMTTTSIWTITSAVAATTKTATMTTSTTSNLSKITSISHKIIHKGRNHLEPSRVQQTLRRQCNGLNELNGTATMMMTELALARLSSGKIRS